MKNQKKSEFQLTCPNCSSKVVPMIRSHKGFGQPPWDGDYKCTSCFKHWDPDELAVPIGYKFPPEAEKRLKESLSEWDD